MNIVVMADPVWDLAILRHIVKKLKETVHEIRWEVSASRGRLSCEICKLRGSLPNGLLEKKN